MRHDSPRCANDDAENRDASRSAGGANGAIISAAKNKRPSRMAGRAVALTRSPAQARGTLLAAARRLLAVGGVVPLARSLLLLGLRLQRDERLVGEQLA